MSDWTPVDPPYPLDDADYGDDRTFPWEVGVLLGLDDGSKLLVGDVNEAAGSCDCCGLYQGSNEGRFIVRWRRVDLS
jgi:hypothetical protein